MGRKVSAPFVCWMLLVSLCAAISIAPQAANAQSGSPNLLKNPSFDWPGQTNGDICAPGWQKDNAITPHEWIPFWMCKSEQEKNQDLVNRAPEFRVMTVDIAKDRVRSYPTGVSFFTFRSINRSMGVYQVVRGITPGAKLRFSVWANLLTTNSDILPLNSSRQPGGLQVRACILTNANIFLAPNLNDPTAVCSAFSRPYDAWGEVAVEATAASDSVAVVVDTTAEYPVLHNDVHLDDASLTMVGASAAPVVAAAQSQQQAAPASVNDNAPRAIVKGETANVRAAPSLTSQILASAPQGMSFPIRAYTTDKEWFQVEYSNGPNGVAYLHTSVINLNTAAQTAMGNSASSQPQQPAASAAPAAQAVAQTVTGAPAQVVVNTGGDRLNVRATPSATGQILGRVTNGASLEVKGVSPDKQWWRITYSGGTDGTAWVMAQWVTPNAAAKQLTGS